MTGLLEEALRRLESLSPEEQNAIAAQIIETLDSRYSLLFDTKYQRAYEAWKAIQPVPGADATKRMNRQETHERRSSSPIN